MGDLPASIAAARAAVRRTAPAALQQQAPIPYRNVRPPRPLPRTMRPPEERVRDPNRSVRVQAAAELAPPDIDLGRALMQAPAAMGEDRRHYVSQLRRGEFPDAAREFPGDMTGLNAISRGVTDFMGGDVRGGIINTGLGGLTAATLGVGPRLAPRGAAPMARPPPRLPTPPPREIGRASDGSVLPIRPAQPFRQSFKGGSADLNEAARMGVGQRMPLSQLEHFDPIDGARPWDLGGAELEDSTVRLALSRGQLRSDPFNDAPDWTADDHAGRIASLMRNGWNDPIVLGRDADGHPYIIDGYHRLAAARLRGDPDIAVRFSDQPAGPPRLNIRPAQPFRQSFVGGSGDLREAARMRTRK